MATSMYVRTAGSCEDAIATVPQLPPLPAVSLYPSRARGAQDGLGFAAGVSNTLWKERAHIRLAPHPSPSGGSEKSIASNRANV